MSGYIYRGECLEAMAKVNSGLTRFDERIRQIRRDMEKLETENKELKDKVQTLEIKYEELRGRTLGWQEGFGSTVREQLKRIDERILNLIVSDDSSDCVMNRQCLEELKAVRKDVSALEKRVAGIEQIKPSIAPKPETPLRFTCHTKEDLCD